MAHVVEVDRPPSFKERVKQERELEIVQVAREVFAEQGYDKASIDEIAERVGIGKGTVYLHFSNKEAIMCAVMRQGTRDVVEQCRKQTAAQHTTVEKLKAVLRVLTEHRYGSERLVRAISSEFPGFLVQKEKAAAISELSDLVTGLIQQGQAEGALRPNVDPRLGAVALLALVFVCPTHLEALAKQELLDNVDQLYFHGISKEAEA